MLPKKTLNITTFLWKQPSTPVVLTAALCCASIKCQVFLTRDRPDLRKLRLGHDSQAIGCA
ncbi:MAG: hypothetical protein JGK31_08880 [Microcoleus sp. PH2017_30_WIL_O_A]|nr:hypothetical protein [Microcoleus sp. PH2017_30_WIL_O_A]